MSEAAELLKQALRLADEADRIAMKYYRSSDLRVKTKPDRTPVTQADLEVETRLNDVVVNEYKHAYLGEEGINNTEGSLLWVVDPIDGTKNFTRNFPVWGSLIAVKNGEETLAAAVSAPALGKRWWAAKDHGAWTREPDGSERQIYTSQVRACPDAFILYSLGERAVWADKLLPFLKTVWRHRSVGDFYNYMMVAEGAADACFESGPKLWDVAAPEFIVREAGGQTFQMQADVAPDQPRDFIASNGVLDVAQISTLLSAH